MVDIQSLPPPLVTPQASLGFCARRSAGTRVPVIDRCTWVEGPISLAGLRSSQTLGSSPLQAALLLLLLSKDTTGPARMCDVWGPQEGRVVGEVMLAVRKGLPPPQLREAAGVPPPDTEEAKVLPSTASC